MDRNTKEAYLIHYDNKVALLAEGVDRNYEEVNFSEYDTKSPSSRRAWIEISSAKPSVAAAAVALLAEGVDRNRSARV